MIACKSSNKFPHILQIKYHSMMPIIHPLLPLISLTLNFYCSKQLVSLRKLLEAIAVNAGIGRHEEDVAAGDLITTDPSAFETTGIECDTPTGPIFISQVCLATGNSTIIVPLDYACWHDLISHDLISQHTLSCSTVLNALSCTAHVSNFGFSTSSAFLRAVLNQLLDCRKFK